jgi:RsiW-degrading membrane proteinase PrsW (M82 family)
MTALARAVSGDWGRVRAGSVNMPVRAIVAVIGFAIWLLIAAILTGVDNTLAAFAANAGFVAGLFVLATVTRTIGWLTVARAFALGALAMAMMLLLGQPLGGLSPNPSDSVDPVAEELLKLAPLALLLWEGRRIGVWQLGATDILLIAAASGAGFAVVEDAYIRLNEGWGETLPFLPTTEIYGDRIRGDRLISGHAIWTALSGITIGLAWLMVRFRLALLLAPIGFVIACADHIGVNSGKWPALGPLVIVVFVAGVAAVLALDLYVLTRKLPSVPELEAAIARPARLMTRWTRTLEGRRLRFAAWRLERKPDATGGGAERAVRRSVAQLVATPGR